jgi:hypothetical protein
MPPLEPDPLDLVPLVMQRSLDGDGGEVLDQSPLGITHDTRLARHRRNQPLSIACYRLKMTFDFPDKRMI